MPEAQRRLIDRHHPPEHVAAYAAALYTGGFGSWMDVTAFIARLGMGDYIAIALMEAATGWERQHVTPAARRTIRRRLRKAWNT